MPRLWCPRDDRARSLAPLWVGLAALLVFSPSLGAGFVFDDLPMIEDNPFVQALGNAAAAFGIGRWGHAAQPTTILGLGYYRPLVTVSYMVNWALGSGRPLIFHATNVVAHAVTAALATRVLLRWVPRYWPAVVGGLLFALHPSRTENVVWIAGRSDVFATLLELVALEVSRLGSRSRGAARLVWWSLATIAGASAFLSKESAAGLPLFFAVDFLVERAKGADVSVRRVPLVASTILAVAYVVGRALWMPVVKESSSLTFRYGLFSTCSQAKRLLLPWPQTFFPDPVPFDANGPQFSSVMVVGGGLVIAAYLLGCRAAFARDRPAGAALVAAAALLVPLLNFLPTGIPNTSADRFLYQSLFFLLSGAGRLYASRNPPARARVWRLAWGGLLLASAGVDLVRILDFEDDRTLWESELRVSPENPMPLRELGRIAARDGDIEGAEKYLDRALSPGSARFRQLASPWFILTTYIHRLALYAGRTADGDVVRLEAVYAELSSIAGGQASGAGHRAPDLPARPPLNPRYLELLLHHPSRAALLASAGVLAARLGDESATRRLLDAIPPGSERETTNPARVALSWASLGETSRALAWVRATGGGERLVRQITDAHRGFARAEAAETTAERGVIAATTMAGLGSYLQALRALRPVYDANPSPNVTRLYVQLLVFARLDTEAIHVASRFLGPSAEGVVDGIRSEVPDALRACRMVTEPSPWWKR